MSQVKLTVTKCGTGKIGSCSFTGGFSKPPKKRRTAEADRAAYHKRIALRRARKGYS